MAHFIIGDYKYTTINSTEVRVEAVSRGETIYSDILEVVIYNGQQYVVTSAHGCFSNCTSLTHMPQMATTITDMSYCYLGCTSLEHLSVIPRDVTNMEGCFSGCTALAVAPSIPDSVTNMHSCFADCTSLVNPSRIPNGVENMGYCFFECSSLETPPNIPYGVESMDLTFYGCTSLRSAPVIPDSVENIVQCFKGCTSLSGDVIIEGTGAMPYLNATFDNTVQPITLYTLRSNAMAIKGTANNVTLAHIDIVPLSSEMVTFNGGRCLRIDLLLDCKQGKYIIDTPNITLYGMDNAPIQIGSSVMQPSLLRCYAIYNNPSQVSNNNLIISIRTMALDYNVATIGCPSAATPTVIRQEGETDPISPTIDVTNIRFNPETTELNKYTIGDVIGITTTDMTKIQTRIRIDASSDTEVRHFITHADNVKVSDGVTLQDWITEQYNNLT